MIVNIGAFRLVFKGLQEEEERAVIGLSTGLQITHKSGALYVYGTGAELFALLVEVCKTYDVELI